MNNPSNQDNQPKSADQSDLLRGLPGEDLIREGLADLQAGRCTIPSCLVAIGLPRLRRSGLAVTEPPAAPGDAELHSTASFARLAATPTPVIMP